MATKIEIEETFKNSQKIRDRHYRESPAFDFFTSHRSSCEYCFRRLRNMELPALKVQLRHPDRDEIIEREILDAADPRTGASQAEANKTDGQ